MLNFLLAAIISLFFSVCSYAETDIFKASTDSIQKLKNKVVVRKLDNGLTVVMYNRGVAPVFSSVVSVKVGGVDEERPLTGISHMFEHMAFKGSQLIGEAKDPALEAKLMEQLESLAKKDPTFQNLSQEDALQLRHIFQSLAAISNADAFSQEYERRGAIGLNATTDKDKTCYVVSLPKSAFEYWAFAESERLINPVMRQFYQERDVVLEERRTRFEDSPTGKLYEQLIQKAYPDHPYGLPLIGFEEDLRSLTASQLKKFSKDFYVPENIVIALVGDIDSEKDWDVIKKYFGRIPAASRASEPTEKPVFPNKEIRFSIEEKAKPFFMIGYHKPNYPHADDAVLSITAEVLNGSSLSPLIDTLVKKERLATSVSNDEAPGNRFSNLLFFGVSPRASVNSEVLLQRFDQVIEQALENPDPVLIQAAKRRVAKSYMVMMKSNSSLASQLAEVQLIYGKWDAMINWYAEAMDVTAEDIKRVGKLYIKPKNRIIGFVNEKQ